VDGTLADIEQQGLTLLAEAGYQRYEVSAFATAGAQCRHNFNYWTFGDYVGVGAGAHGKLSQIKGSDAAIVRSRKASQPRLYLGNPAQTEYADVANSARVVEFMLNALRLVDGVSFRTFESRTGLAWSTIAPTWETLVDQQLVRSDRCATTARGLRYLDGVVASFLT
jgi:oxygen-independent coproporphyrinogen-3 oxidase